MAWTVTDRGQFQQTSGNGDITSASFTPAANSIVVAVLFRAPTTAVSGITGHAAGGAWVQIGQQLWGSANNFIAEIWAAFPGASPSASVITVTVSAYDLKIAHFLEFSGGDVSGTVANAFGTEVGSAGLGLAAESVTLSAFGSATNLTFAIAAANNGGDTFTWEGGYSTDTVTTSVWRTQCAWKDSEDTSPSITFGSESVYDVLLAVEMKEAGGAVAAPKRSLLLGIG